jgi:fumarylacetoacetate (FAA) hydrolase
MRLIDFIPNEAPDALPRFGLLCGGTVVELSVDGGTLQEWLERGMTHTEELRLIAAHFDETGKVANPQNPAQARLIRRTLTLDAVRLVAPVRRPPTLRDFYAFEQHVKAGNAIRGREIPPQWYEIPVFYFSNPTSIIGPGDAVRAPKASQALDYELEVACVIGKSGRDIAPEEAGDYIAGYLIFNDWSARDLQRQEVAVGLGPAKGKDFASSFGPMLVTPDDLADRHAGRPGVYNLTMTARVNGVERSRGNWSDLHHSFGDMIARASADATLYPGDLIGSGTVGTGCLLELTKAQGPWLQSGDVVELEIERLGVLRNTVY